MSEEKIRDHSPERKSNSPRKEVPVEKSLEEILNDECGPGFTQILIVGTTGAQPLNWRIWESALKKFADSRNLTWNALNYAEILGFFIWHVFTDGSGELETKLLLSHLTYLQGTFQFERIETTVTGLNKLELFPRPQSSHQLEFAKKFALWTTLGFPWVLQYGNGVMQDTWYLWDMSKKHKALAELVTLDPRYTLKYPGST